ncbi:hypothetical protein ACFVTY_39680 [Streptomyces sp. NPDC058067]|uniref:hypothetical protein n=1 Tax=Streptomyces sp. NPDC058067 TaxID=3346324 RepID=UPI0036E88727
MPRRLRGALHRAAPALALYVAARLTGLALAALVSVWTKRPMWPRLGASWDSKWYMGIAQHGYGTVITAKTPGVSYNDMAFFPLYPALERAVATLLPVGAVEAGLAAAWLAAGAAAVGIYAVGERLHGRRVGITLVLLWGLLPHAIVQTMAYSESLMTALSAFSLYAVLTRRWLWAGSLALLAGLTRPNGLAVAAAVVAAAALVLWRSRGARDDWRVWAGAALAPLGWAGYVAWVGLRSGRLLGYFDIQSNWGSRFDFGVSEFEFLKGVFTDRGTPAHLTYYMGAAVLLVALAALVLFALDRPPLPVLVYALVLVVIAFGGTKFYACKPRFLLPAFPLLLPAALALTRARPRTAAVLVSCVALISFVYGVHSLFYASTAP